MIVMEEEKANVRVVRCPKCNKLLPELANFSLYRCGGCSAILQAKKEIPPSDVSSSEKSNAENVTCSVTKAVIVSDALSEFAPKVESIDDFKNEEELNFSESPNSDSIFLKSSDNSSSTNVVVSVKEKTEDQDTIKFTDERPKFQPRNLRQDEGREGVSTYPDEGPSRYHPNDAQKRRTERDYSAELSDQDRAELLWKLDELRDQLKRSCEVAENPKERTSTTRTTFSSNSRGPYSRHTPTNRQSTNLHNLYPPVYPYTHVRAHYPHHPIDNYLHPQFNPDPLVSYHHEGFYQQPTCSCLHCRNTHWPNDYNNQRLQYPVHSRSLYRVDDVQSRHLNNGRSCRPVAGAAPFVSCHHCSELLKLPVDFSWMSKSKHNLRCGSCSKLLSYHFDGKILTPCANEKLVLPSFPVSNSETVEKAENAFHLSESKKIQGDSSSPSPDSMICQRDSQGISRVNSLPLREHLQAFDEVGNGSRSMRSEQEKVLTVNGILRQNSVKEIPIATEMDFQDDEYPDSGFYQDPWQQTSDERHATLRNSKTGDSFFAGLIKKRFNGKCKVSINGHPILGRAVKKAEKRAGPVHPGDYWYDYRAGFWGVIGNACLGIIPPFIEEFNYPMPRKCAGGNTGILVNGRELHLRDLDLLASRGLPTTQGCSYIIEISGKVWDEDSGEELDSLGKLAPTIEKVKHGFGMQAPT